MAGGAFSFLEPIPEYGQNADDRIPVASFDKTDRKTSVLLLNQFLAMIFRTQLADLHALNIPARFHLQCSGPVAVIFLLYPGLIRKIPKLGLFYRGYLPLSLIHQNQIFWQIQPDHVCIWTKHLAFLQTTMSFGLFTNADLKTWWSLHEFQVTKHINTSQYHSVCIRNIVDSTHM